MSKVILTAQLPPVRLTTEEKAALKDLADDDSRSLSNYVRRVLVNHINQQKAPNQPDISINNHSDQRATVTETIVGDVAKVDVVIEPAPTATTPPAKQSTAKNPNVNSVAGAADGIVRNYQMKPNRHTDEPDY